MEFAALARFTFHPNASSHHSHEFFGNRKTQPGSTIVPRGGAIRLGEGFKDQGLFRLGDSNPGIDNLKVEGNLVALPGFRLDAHRHFTLLW